MSHLVESMGELFDVVILPREGQLSYPAGEGGLVSRPRALASGNLGEYSIEHSVEWFEISPWGENLYILGQSTTYTRVARYSSYSSDAPASSHATVGHEHMEDVQLLELEWPYP